MTHSPIKRVLYFVQLFFSSTYAHYAMLMSKSGNEGEALKYLEMEKSAYPDSAHYIDFLLTHARQIKKAGSKGAEKKKAVQTDDSQQIKEYRQ